MALFPNYKGGEPRIDDPGDPRADYDRSKPSRAVFALSGGRGLLLHARGYALENWVEWCGDHDPNYLGFDVPQEEGLWAWEGKIASVPGGQGEPPDAEPRGEWRRLTADELAMVAEGECPWPVDDWKKKK